MKKMLLKAIVCLIFAAAGFGYMLGVGGVHASAAQAKKQRKSQSQLLAQGKTLYLTNCARCHGGDGLGKTALGEMVEAPNLTDAKWQARRSNSRMQTSIMRGRGQMPGFGGKLSKDEVAALVAYTRAFKK